MGTKSDYLFNLFTKIKTNISDNTSKRLNLFYVKLQQKCAIKNIPDYGTTTSLQRIQTKRFITILVGYSCQLDKIYSLTKREKFRTVKLFLFCHNKIEGFFFLQKIYINVLLILRPANQQRHYLL